MRRPLTTSAEIREALRAELVGDDTAIALGHTITGNSPVLALCRRLVDLGINPATPLEAYRGNALALLVRSIGEAANLEIDDKGCGFKRRAAVGTAPPIAESDRVDIGRLPALEAAP